MYNAIPGRYVNRIGNGKYTLDNVTHTTEKNDGSNTLHSGSNNWSYRTWDVAAATEDSITFSISDASNSSMGMLGLVEAKVTYSVSDGTWKIKMEAVSPEERSRTYKTHLSEDIHMRVCIALTVETALMLTQHTYFNLDAFKDPSTNKIWNHTLYLPYSQRYLVADDAALPTGEIGTAKAGSINDFASEPSLGLGHAQNDPAFPGNCGAGGQCEGYNGYFLIDDAPKNAVVASLASPFSGIKADLRTDQAGVVVYTGNWFDGTALLKSTQGLGDRLTVGRSSCVAIEAQDYVDGINQ